MNHEKEKWVDEVLTAAENIQRAKPGSGFYAKTLNRIKAESPVSTDYVLRIAAGLLILITLNVFACVSFSKKNNSADSAQLQAFAKEYCISGTSDNF